MEGMTSKVCMLALGSYSLSVSVLRSAMSALEALQRTAPFLPGDLLRRRRCLSPCVGASFCPCVDRRTFSLSSGWRGLKVGVLLVQGPRSGSLGCFGR